MHLIAGLGNPGTAYQNNRHNVGFMAVDAIIHRFSLLGPKSKFKSEVYEGRIGTKKVLALKPQTFMNASGEAIGEAMRFYKLGPEDVTVLYDELDLAPLKVKAKAGGGAAGHNGIRSTIQHIGDGFQRVRIGIGHPGARDKVSPYVLSDFAKAEAPDFDDLCRDIADVADWLVAGDLPRFMTELARKRQPDQPSKAPKPAKAETASASKPASDTAGAAGASGPFAALGALKDKFLNKDTD